MKMSMQCRAASIPRGKGGTCLQMKLVYNELAPIFICLLQWLDCSCSCLFSSHLNLFHVIVHKVNENSCRVTWLVLFPFPWERNQSTNCWFSHFFSDKIGWEAENLFTWKKSHRWRILQYVPISLCLFLPYEIGIRFCLMAFCDVRSQLLYCLHWNAFTLIRWS